MEQSRNKSLAAIPEDIRYARYNTIAMVRNKTYHFVKMVRAEEQPYKRVWDMVQNARRRRGADGPFEFDDTVIQTREYLIAKALMLLC